MAIPHFMFSIENLQKAHSNQNYKMIFLNMCETYNNQAKLGSGPKLSQTVIVGDNNKTKLGNNRVLNIKHHPPTHYLNWPLISTTYFRKPHPTLYNLIKQLHQHYFSFVCIETFLRIYIVSFIFFSLVLVQGTGAYIMQCSVVKQMIYKCSATTKNSYF